MYIKQSCTCFCSGHLAAASDVDAADRVNIFQENDFPALPTQDVPSQAVAVGDVTSSLSVLVVESLCV